MAQGEVTTINTGATTSTGTTPMGAAASRYKALGPKRQPYLDRARRCSALTMPSLYPPEGQVGADTEIGWNSLGAYLLGNLGAKLTLAMFPPGRPPMKLKQDRAAAIDLQAIESDDERGALKAEIEAGLSKVEQEYIDAVEEDGDRAKLSVTALKLLCGGTHCLHMRSNGMLKGISLERFVCVRDPSGNLLEFVIAEPLAWETLPEDIQDECRRRGYEWDANKPIQTPITVYTHGLFKRGSWTVYQECYGFEVNGSRATYNPKALPFLFLPFVLLDEEDYGRSYAENYEGDLQTVDGLDQSVTEAAAAFARFIELVSPVGLTNKRQYAEAKNGDVITGRAEDITVPDSKGKRGDIQQATTSIDRIILRLSKAFLAATSVVRDAERVTTQEIRMVAGELEEALGGVYSQQAITWQIPYVRLKLAALQRQRRVTPLPMGSVSVQIVGGMAALGRNAELAALDSLLAGASQHFGPEKVAEALTPAGIRNYFLRRAAALGVDTAGLIPDEKAAAQFDQNQMMQALIEKLGPQAMQQLGTYTTQTQVADTRASAQVEAAALKQTAPSTPTAQ